MQINTWGNRWGKKVKIFFTQRENFMYNICLINNEAHIMNNLSQTAFHKVSSNLKYWDIKTWSGQYRLQIRSSFINFVEIVKSVEIKFVQTGMCCKRKQQLEGAIYKIWTEFLLKTFN